MYVRILRKDLDHMRKRESLNDSQSRSHRGTILTQRSIGVIEEDPVYHRIGKVGFIFLTVKSWSPTFALWFMTKHRAVFLQIL